MLSVTAFAPAQNLHPALTVLQNALERKGGRSARPLTNLAIAFWTVSQLVISIGWLLSKRPFFFVIALCPPHREGRGGSTCVCDRGHSTEPAVPAWQSCLPAARGAVAHLCTTLFSFVGPQSLVSQVNYCYQKFTLGGRLKHIWMSVTWVGR